MQEIHLDESEKEIPNKCAICDMYFLPTEDFGLFQECKNGDHIFFHQDCFNAYRKNCYLAETIQAHRHFMPLIDYLREINKPTPPPPRATDFL